MKVKICGLSTRDAVEEAVADGADFIGFVFAESRRKVEAEKAAEISCGIPQRVKKVGVFVSPTISELRQTIRIAGLDLVQIHGEMPETKGLAVPVIRAVSVTDGALPEGVLEENFDFLLLDAPPKEYQGGNGAVFDWEKLDVKRLPMEKVFIAGGLKAENVAQAEACFHPYAVDVSSGVETDGQKDLQKIRLFLEAAKRKMEVKNMYKNPDTKGFYGDFGGQFIPETLMHAVKELEEVYEEAKKDDSFQEELDYYLKQYVGRENPLYFAKRLTEYAGGAKIYLKREDLNHTGAHKINNALGQVILAKRMGKNKIVAETGAGQHGVATATAAALFGMECIIFMGAVDVKRQALNVFRMELLGAKVVSVQSGSKTLKDAVNEALRYWVENVEDTHYVLGSAMGPHPFPEIVRDFQSVIGKEARRQFLEAEGRLPDALVACIGGGSNSIGLFHPFIDDPGVRMIGVEAAGLGVETGHHAATITAGKVGVLHGAKMNLLQDADGQVQEAFSISAGLDYPGVGPEHSYLNEIGRAQYVAVTDDEAVEAFQLLSRVEGIIPALESAHAISFAVKEAGRMKAEEAMIVCLSGRGDKDVNQIRERLEAGK